MAPKRVVAKRPVSESENLLAIEDKKEEKKPEQQQQQEQEQQPAEEEGQKQTQQMGRPTTGPKMSSTQRVAFSRWCSRQSIQSKELDGESLADLKATWLVNPETAASKVVSSTTRQSTSSKTKHAEGWMTRNAIAKEENLPPDSEEMDELLAGLSKRPSRFGHLSKNEKFQEYNYQSFAKKEKTKERYLGTDLQVTSAELQEEEAADISSNLMSMSSNSSSSGKRSAEGKATPKPKVPKTTSHGATMQGFGRKLLKYAEELQDLVERGQEAAQQQTWMEGLVKKVEMDKSAVLEANRQLWDVILVAPEKLGENEVNTWQPRVESLCARGSSYKLLKQVSSHPSR